MIEFGSQEAYDDVFAEIAVASGADISTQVVERQRAERRIASYLFCCPERPNQPFVDFVIERASAHWQVPTRDVESGVSNVLLETFVDVWAATAPYILPEAA